MIMRGRSYRLPAWVQDALLALFITAMQVQGTLSRAAADPASVLRPLSDLGHLGDVLLIASGLVVAVRRRFPTVTFAVTALASLAYYTLDFPDGPGWVGLFVALYTLTAHGDGRRSLVVAGVGITILTACWLVASTDIEPRAAIGWVFFRIGASVMSAALGESVRSRRVIASEALERAELAEQTREDEARARAAQERLSIAREVHDTVAHAIAVINVQAGVTAHVLDKRPDRARETLVAIEHTSSRALQEMRTILGVLRADDGARAPHPGLDQLDELLERAREAGLDLKVEGTAAPTTPLPSAVDAAAYRILQEAITNVIRHVGPTRVTIGLEHGTGALQIRVTDEGLRGAGITGGEHLRAGRAGHRTAGTPPGHGIDGMRERCELLGGRLDAGPLLDGGFEVRASLPVATTGASPA